MTRPRETIRTTLGELIAAVTDEVTAAFGDSPATYIVVSYIVSDILTPHRSAVQRGRERAVIKKRQTQLLAQRSDTVTDLKRER